MKLSGDADRARSTPHGALGSARGWACIFRPSPTRGSQRQSQVVTGRQQQSVPHPHARKHLSATV